MMPRSIQSTQLFHSRTMAAISPRNGTTTPIMFAMRSALVMRCRLTHIGQGFLWNFRAFGRPDLSRNSNYRERFEAAPGQASRGLQRNPPRPGAPGACPAGAGRGASASALRACGGGGCRPGTSGSAFRRSPALQADGHVRFRRELERERRGLRLAAAAVADVRPAGDPQAADARAMAVGTAGAEVGTDGSLGAGGAGPSGGGSASAAAGVPAAMPPWPRRSGAPRHR